MEVSPSSPPRFSKSRLVKNLVVVSVASWLLFSAYDGLVILQSTVNSAEGVGVVSVTVQYAVGCLSAVLLPKYLIQKLGQKAVMAACVAGHLPFIAANFYPSWLLMVASSVLLGAANPLLWAALCAYLNDLSSLYSARSHQKDRPDDASLLESTTARFFGFHGAIYQSCHISSNLVSYFILSRGVEGYVRHPRCRCGLDFCNEGWCSAGGNLKPPEDSLRYVLSGVCLALGVGAVALVVLLADELDREKKKRGAATALSLDILAATCKLMKEAELWCLVPLSIYIGVLQGFAMGDYTQSFVGCAWGIPNIGLAMAVYGLTISLGATLSGWAVRYVGRPTVFLCTQAWSVALFLLIFLVPPDGERPAVMLVMGAIIGAVLGSYWAQLRAFYGVIFKEDEEAGFGNYQLWHSVGMCISFGLSKYVCTSIKFYIVIFFSTAGILGYLLAERLHSKKELKEKG